jgi:Right handed beta helix region
MFRLGLVVVVALLVPGRAADGQVTRVGPRVAVGPQMTSAPGGAVIVNPGENLNTVTRNNPAGTVFYLNAGTYSRQTVMPKQGDTYIGALGAILDGGNTATLAFGGAVGGVTIENLRVTNYASARQHAPLDSRNWTGAAGGWTFKNLEVDHNGGSGIEFMDGDIVVANAFHDNTQEGFAGGDGGSGKGGVFTDNVVYNNNSAISIDPAWEAGGGKFWNCKNWKVQYNHFYNNGGPGLWFDTDNDGADVGWNLSENNWGPGIMWEISWDVNIHDNVVRNNGTRSDYKEGPWPPWVAQILISSSGGYGGGPNGGLISIHNNAIVTNYDNQGMDGLTPAYGSALSLVAQNRGSGAHGRYLSRNIAVSGNTMNLTAGGNVMVANDFGDSSQFTDNIKFTGNTYIRPGANTFWWNRGTGNLRFWQSQGQD